MAIDFEILPWLLLAAWIFLIAHSFFGKKLRLLAMLGALALSTGMFLSIQMTPEEIQGNIFFLIVQTSCLWVFICALVIISLAELSALVSKMSRGTSS